MKLSDVGLGYKLTLVFGLLAIVTAGIAIVGLNGIRQMKSMYEQNMTTIEIISDIQKAREFERAYQVKGEISDLENIYKCIESANKRLDDLKVGVDDEQVLASLDEISNLVSKYKDNIKEYSDIEKEKQIMSRDMDALGTELSLQLGRLRDANGKEAAILLLQARVDAKKFLITSDENLKSGVRINMEKAGLFLKDAIYSREREELNRYTSALETYAAQAGRQNKIRTSLADSYKRIEELNSAIRDYDISEISKFMTFLYTELLVMIILAIVLCNLLAVVITRSIRKGVNKAVRIAEALSEGELDVEIEEDFYGRKDEIGQLTSALGRMIQKLREVVDHVVSGANNISAASKELSDSSHLVSQGASEQASAAEEASSSIQQMTANIHQNSDNSILAGKMARQVASDILEGSQGVNQTIEAMRQIAGKIGIINDIAFQTNILALNAAVEAARAGEHGKGFAVVAAEVRKLAERSQKAASEINTLAGLSMEEADKSGSRLQNLVGDIQKTAQLVQEISEASAEQNSGANQLNLSIQQLNQVVQQNAASSEEIATSAEELETQASQLHGVVSFFKAKRSKSGYSNQKHKQNEKPSQKQKQNFNNTKESVKNPERNYTPLISSGMNLHKGGPDELDSKFERF